MKYTLTLPQSRSIRGNHTVDPKFHGSTIATLTVNTTAGGDEVWECLVDGEYLNAKKGDKWLHILEPVDGWVAVIHAGVEQCELVENTIINRDGVAIKLAMSLYSSGYDHWNTSRDAHIRN